jgi:hypothetical protein
MSALTLIVMLGICGFALTLAQLYNRTAEMQTLADSVALAAARQLDGTPAGITNALTAAQNAANELHFQYNNKDIRWSAAAMKFSNAPAPGGDWAAGGSTAAVTAGQLFVRVDTSELDLEHGLVNGGLLSVLSPALSSAHVSARAIAGRSTINVTPFAVCAMSPLPATARVNPAPPSTTELVQHGFRRGVSYDLMQLNPGGAVPTHFVVNPIAPPGTLGSSAYTTPAAVAPFVCSGTMAMTRIMGQPITVGGPFPLAALFGALNSRFNQYGAGLCNARSAPPDENIAPYVFTNIPWMSSARNGQAAQATVANNRLETIADLFPAPSTNTAGMYGPLWSFAKAVPFSAYVAGSPEPVAGYAPFAPSYWSSLYKPNNPANPAPQVSTYPANNKTPYHTKLFGMFLAPSGTNFPGVLNRRVLNVPLLACPVGAGAAVNADVLAIGRFFMTVPATSNALVAEFAGLATEQSVGGKVELFQ